MKRLLPFALLACLLLSGCGSKTDDETGGSLSTMFGSENATDPVVEDTTNPDEVPSSKGPSEIPPELVPHE